MENLNWIKKLNENKFLFLLALFKFVLHIVTGWQYGYFRDELYYFAMSEHPDFGYLDVTPIVPHIMRLSRFLFGNSVIAIHIFPALAGALTVLLAGLIAKRMGGGTYAQILTAAAILAAPQFQIFNSMFTYDCFDQLMSAVLIYVLAGILKEENHPKQWLIFGAVAGIGLMVKISMLFLGFSIVVSLLLTSARKHFTSKWIWLGGLIAFVVFTPYIAWQAMHHFPILEYWGEYAESKAYKASPLEYISMQITTLNYLNVPVLIAGLWYLLFGRAGEKFRALGWTHVTYLVLSIMMSFKFYILSGSYYAVIAAGAIVAENFFARLKLKWLKPLYASTILIVGLIMFPLCVPVFPIEDFISYNKAMNPASNDVKAENLDTGGLPQQFADRFGWEQMVKTVADVYYGLPESERNKCAILAMNYGEAGAIDLFGSKYGLPKAISPHLSYYTWGPRDYTGEYIIIIGYGKNQEKELEKNFEEVVESAVFSAQYAIPHENNKPIYLCKKLKAPLKDIWPKIKNMS